MNEIRTTLRAMDYRDLRELGRRLAIKRDVLEDFIDGVGDVPAGLEDWYATHLLRKSVSRETPARVAEVTGIDAQVLFEFSNGTRDLPQEQLSDIRTYLASGYEAHGDRWRKVRPVPAPVVVLGVAEDRLKARKAYPHPLDGDPDFSKMEVPTLTPEASA